MMTCNNMHKRLLKGHFQCDSYTHQQLGMAVALRRISWNTISEWLSIELAGTQFQDMLSTLLVPYQCRYSYLVYVV